MKKIIMLLSMCLFCAAISVVVSNPVREVNAQNAYQKMLNKYKKSGFTMYVKYDVEPDGSDSEEGFPLLLTSKQIRDGVVKYTDLNGDGKSECILVTGEHVNIFTMKGKKVKYLGGIHLWYADSLLHRRGAREFTIYRYGGKMFHYFTFRIRNGMLKKVCTFGNQVLNHSNGNPYNEYYYNDKQTSKKKYNSTCRKYVDGISEINLNV